MNSLSLTNSVVMTDPALSSGYLSIWLISFLSWESAWERIREATFAGISSTRSAASSAKRFSRICLSSRSEKARIKASCVSLSVSGKTSPAKSLGSSLNRTGRIFSSTLSKSAARSDGFIVRIISLIVE